MRILMGHNYYQQYGGEDALANLEVELLQNHGHEVYFYTRDNDEINSKNIFYKGLLPFQTIWSHETYREIKYILQTFKPEVAHFTNFFPLISPSAYYACRHAGVPVVQSLHNYRLLCPSATLYRNGRLCEKCLMKKIPWPGVWHSCYRDSPVQTTVVASMLAIHNSLKTWSTKVDTYIVTTEFSRRKLIEGGLPSNKIRVKPNFLQNQPNAYAYTEREDFGLFVGRLVPEKGILTLLSTWSDIAFPLKIMGKGPLLSKIQPILKERKRMIHYLGWQPHENMLQLMRQARFLILPSEWYEGLPMTLLAAFACGLPIIGSQFGSLEELIQDGKTGLHFKAGNTDDLHQKIQWAIEHPEEMALMGKNARVEYEEKYSAEKNYQLLLNIYKQAKGTFHPNR